MSILPPPPEFFEICGQLLRYCEKINPQRIKDTPPVNFFLCLVLASPISKKITNRMSEGLSNSKFVQQIKTTNLQLINIQGCIFINRHGCRWFQACKSFANAKL